MYTKHKWNSDKYFNFGYICNLPKDYDPEKKYPLVIFLHGAGERGEDLEKVAVHGYLKHIREQDKDYPFILIAPQCPLEKYWGCYTESMLAFIDYLYEAYPVDVDRVYLTGLSMGGTGTWMLAMADPKRFAAIAPICGSGIYWNGGCLSKLPIMVYHGDCDTAVPILDSVNMITSVNKNGGNAQIKVCTGVGHNVSNIAYSDDALIDWLLSHTRQKSE